MSQFYSCAITSQRPTRFKFKYQEYMTSCKRLKKRLHDVFAELYRRGVRRFYVGGPLVLIYGPARSCLKCAGRKSTRSWKSYWSIRSRAMTSDGTRRAGSGCAI